jgi:hypothetical protein
LDLPRLEVILEGAFDDADRFLNLYLVGQVSRFVDSRGGTMDVGLIALGMMGVVV